MSYPINVNIPNAPNDPADDQPLMKQNYANISAFLAVDHVAPGTVGDGYHKQVHLLNETAPGIGGANGVLFANLANGQSWPFWQNALYTVQMLSGNPSVAANGYTFLPGGIIIQWGKVNSTSGSFQTLTFATNNIAFPNNCFVVVAQVYGHNQIPSGFANIFIDQTSVSNTGFKWLYATSSSKYDGFYWIAIGN